MLNWICFRKAQSMTGNLLLELLKRKRPLLADGAMGTRLLELGLPSGTPPELWNEQAPDAVLQVHKSYIEAGSDIILTNSFGAGRRKLARLGLADKAASLARRAAELAREAAGDRAAVLGSIGPTGELLKPLGKLTLKEARESYAEQAQALAQGGVDALILETFFDLEELKAALVAALQATDLPIACSMTFRAGGKTMMGVSVERFAREIEALGEERIVLLGANCGAGPKEMEAIADDLAFSAGLEVSYEALHEVLMIIQEFDPAGVGARNLQECLLLQIARKNLEDPVIKLARTILKNNFEEFTNKHYDKIIQRLNIAEEELKIGLEMKTIANKLASGQLNYVFVKA